MQTISSHVATNRFERLVHFKSKKTLYYRGNVSLLAGSKILGIVGSREMTEYGRRCLTKLFSELVTSDIIVVSGLSRGVDSYSHRLSLDAEIKNIAVLPCGIDSVYPITNKPLLEDILQFGGLVISEYSGNVAPRDWCFIERNKIIASLSDILLVVEAGAKSGSLSAARFALKLGKKVYVVPGDIFRANSQGICQLLLEDATSCHSGSQINTYFGLNASTISAAQVLDMEWVKHPLFKKLLNCLKLSPYSFDDLLIATNIPSDKLNNYLIELEIAGKIYNEGGYFYVC